MDSCLVCDRFDCGNENSEIGTRVNDAITKRDDILNLDIGNLDIGNLDIGKLAIFEKVVICQLRQKFDFRVFGRAGGIPL